MKRLLTLLLTMCMILSLTACGEKNPPANNAGNNGNNAGDTNQAGGDTGDSAGSYKLGFILGSREHAFYCSIEDGINAAAKDLGFEAVVLESDLKGDIASQRIEDLVVDECDAISLACNEPAGCTNAIVNADKEGVPMFTFDCTTDLTDVVKCFVGTDNFEGGAVGGRASIKLLEDAGMTCLLYTSPSQRCLL